MILALRYAFYLLRLILYTAYGVVRFFAKPGSHVIVPAAAFAIGVLQRPQLHESLTHWYARYQPAGAHDPLFFDVLLGIAWLLLTVAYYLASRLLALILGAFPPITRPLPPLRRLKPKETTIIPAVVRVVVPPLPRRRAPEPPPWRMMPAPVLPPAAEPEPSMRKAAAE